MKNLTIGGPSYRLEVSAPHCASVAAITALMGRLEYKVDIRYKHATPVSIARNQLMRELIDDGCDYWLTLDSDVSVRPSVARAAIQYVYATDCPVLIIPCRLRAEDKFNVVTAPGKPWLTKEEIRAWQRPQPIYSAGLGAAVINLQCWRDTKEPWFLDVWATEGFTSEDIVFTSTTRARTGHACQAFPTPADHTPQRGLAPE